MSHHPSKDCHSTLKQDKTTNVIIKCFCKLIISAYRTDFSLGKLTYSVEINGAMTLYSC